MRFDKGHKAATRQRIIDVASQKFRKDGVEAVGIAGLMAEAGLTHGGFYAHFASKEALVREAMAAAMDQTGQRFDRAAARDNDGLGAAGLGAAGLEGMVRRYLRAAHRDTPEHGCAIASLVSEIARHEPETRAVFSQRVEKFLARIAGQLPAGAAPELVQSTAIGILGVMLGTLQLSRAMTDPALSDRILESGIGAAMTLAQAAKTLK